MKKVIFKGTINGKEFDNVKDYNEEMNKLISEGATKISASSSTEIAEEIVDEDKECPNMAGKLPDVYSIDDFLPFFNSCDEHYLDRLVSDDDKLNEESLTYTKNIFDSTFNTLMKTLDENKLSLDESFELINKIKTIKNTIANDNKLHTDKINEIIVCIKELESDINNLETKLELLKKYTPVIEAFQTYYSTCFDLVKSYILKNKH